MANVLAHNPLNIGFRRALTGRKWTDWLHLCQRLMMVQLSNNPDKFIWNLTTSGIFSVKSMYLNMMDDDTRYLRNIYGN